MLVNGWLEMFIGLMAVGFITLLLRLRKPKNKRIQTPLFGARRIQDWDRMFAWKPVRTSDDGVIWLRPYWRRKVYHDFSGDEMEFFYQNVTKIWWYLW